MIHVYIIIGFIFLFSILYIVDKKLKSDENAFFVKNYENYHIVLTLHMDKAFEIIYKEKIIAYSLEAMKMNNVQFQAISKDFGYLVLKMIGPGLTKAFINMYGSEETFLFNIMEYFNNKFENDEIYRATTDDLINGDTKDLFWGSLNDQKQ